MSLQQGISWYACSTGTHQGLIVDEATGRHVAVAYDKADAPLLAAAPEFLATLEEVSELLRSLVAEDMISQTESERVGAVQANIWSVIAKAEGAK